MAKLPSCIKRRSANTYILSALLGALVAVAVVASIAVSLAPAHISFTVANGRIISRPEENKPNEAPTKYYNITMVANNKSRRTKVQYSSLSIQIWFNPTGWVPGEANLTAGELAEWQRPGKATSFPILTKFFDYNNEVATISESGDEQLDDTEKGRISWPKCLVLVEAKVWFRFRLVATRQYTVRASCYPVDFERGVTSPINCTS